MTDQPQDGGGQDTGTFPTFVCLCVLFIFLTGFSMHNKPAAAVVSWQGQYQKK
jgi:hypothetical protein